MAEPLTAEERAQIESGIGGGLSFLEQSQLWAGYQALEAENRTLAEGMRDLLTGAEALEQQLAEARHGRDQAQEELEVVEHGRDRLLAALAETQSRAKVMERDGHTAEMGRLAAQAQVAALVELLPATCTICGQDTEVHGHDSDCPLANPTKTAQAHDQQVRAEALEEAKAHLRLNRCEGAAYILDALAEPTQDGEEAPSE